MTELVPIEIDPKTFFRKNFTLPALPEVVNEIQNVLSADDPDIEKVAELISSEPSLVAQALKVVNSAYYGLPQEITKVKSAIVFLGLSEIYRMVLSLSVVNTLAIKQKKELTDFWFHSFYTALSTRYLAKKYNPYLPFEELWSAAILHDIGKLIYLKFFPDHYKALRHYCREKKRLFSDAERHFSLPSSALFGALLCEHWTLPDFIGNACRSHTLRDLKGINADDPSTHFIQMICLGNVVTTLSTEELDDEVKHDIASSTMAALECSEARFLAMMGDIYELKIEVDKFTAQFR